MKRRKTCSWWRGCSWSAGELTDFMTMRRTCTRCGLIEVFDGSLDETYYIEPKENDGEEAQRATIRTPRT